MRRWAMLAVAIVMIGPAMGADLSDTSRRYHQRPLPPDEKSDRLFTPMEEYLPLIRRPLLPGSSALPGYYGSAQSPEYHEPYYGSPKFEYWNRLPYACGVYGYC